MNAPPRKNKSSKKRGKSASSGGGDSRSSNVDSNSNNSSSLEGSSGKRKSAKDRKRELESMYGSLPIEAPPKGHGSPERLTSSLPVKLDMGKPPKGNKKSKKKNKAGGDAKSAKAKTSTSKLQDSDGSIGIDELEKPPSKQIRQQPPSPQRPRSSSRKMKRQQSTSITNEQSMQLDQIMMQNSIMGHQNNKNNNNNNRSQFQRGRSQAAMSRQASARPSMQRGRSQDRSRPLGMSSHHSNAFGGSSHHTNNTRRQQMMRSNSVDASTRRGLARGASSRRGRSLDRSTSITLNTSSMLDRSASVRRGSRPAASLGTHLDRQKSMARSKSISMMNRSRSGSRSDFSFDGNSSMMGSVVSINGQKGRVVLQPVSADDAKRLKTGGKRGYIRRFIPYKEPEEKPPRSLVLIWGIVAAELGFDLATTIIAFRSFIGEDTCCGKPITLGAIPVSSTIPFFMLIVAELTFLIRAIVLTMWPSLMTGDDDTELDNDDIESGGKKRDQRSWFRRTFCCFLRWKIKVLLQFLNFLVLLNPFFGCIIAWILMYQSDKTEAFIVLGMEGAALVLHYFSVWLEGSLKTLKGFLINSVPLVPFAISIGLVLYYLKQGGVCYLTDQRVFKFTGCEVCNISGVVQPCPNSTNLFSGITDIGSLDEARDKILERSDQATYCSAETSFCFYDYDDGQVPDVNANETAAPSELLFGPDDVTSIPFDPTPTDPQMVVPTPSPEVPDNTPPTNPPTIPPTSVPLTEPPTRTPTEAPTSVPTPVPTEPPPTDVPQPDTGGSDGFNPDDTGSDGFNMDDLFGRNLRKIMNI